MLQFSLETQRIKAQIAICYMALVCVRNKEHKVSLQYKKMTPAAIRNELQKNANLYPQRL
jgi:hypothetical protein